MSVDRLIKIRKVPFLGWAARVVISILGVDLPNGVKIGKNVSFRHNAIGTVIHSNTIIEDNVKIYQNVTLGRADVNVSPQKTKFEGILVREGAILSTGAKVLCKKGTLVIGKNSIVAANAVLLNSIGDNEIWGGIPATKIGDVPTSENTMK